MPLKENEIKTAINEEIWSIYDSNTKILSGICRQLAFAEGGICWFFKSSSCQLSQDVIFILKFLIIFFALDAAQYFLAVIIYWFVAKYYECCNSRRLIKNSKEIDRSGWMSRGSSLLFLAKIVFIAIASYYTINLLT